MDSKDLPQKLNLKLKLSYGVGHILNDLSASMWFSYVLLYLHKVAHVTPVNAGWLILIGETSDALATPFVGYQSDKTVCSLYGRRKLWHLIGVICVAFSFPFIFNLCIYRCSDASQTILMAYYMPFIIIFQAGWAATQVAHLALIPELTDNEQGKVELTALRYMFTVISNLVVFAVCLVLFELPSTSVSDTDDIFITRHDATKFRYLAICVVALGLIFVLIFHTGVKEKVIRRNVKSTSDEEVQTLLDSQSSYGEQFTVRSWFKTPIFYQIGWMYMMTRIIVNVTQVYIPYYVLDVLHLEKTSIAIAPAVIYVSGLIASFTAKLFNKKLGLKLTFFFGLCLVFSSSIWFFYLPLLSGKARLQVYGACILLGMGASMLAIDSLAMISEMIDKNTETGAFVYGSMGFLDKLSNGGAIMLIQYLHPSKDEIFCNFECRNYYRYLESIVPGACAFTAFLVLLTIGKREISTTRDPERNCSSKDATAEDSGCEISSYGSTEKSVNAKKPDQA